MYQLYFKYHSFLLNGILLLAITIMLIAPNEELNTFLSGIIFAIALFNLGEGIVKIKEKENARSAILKR